jgi:hypothetical protein
MGATAGHTCRLSSPLSKRRGLAAHAETGFSAVTELAGGWILAGTDVGSIGEMTVGEDGLYVVYEGRIARCGVPL